MSRISFEILNCLILIHGLYLCNIRYVCISVKFKEQGITSLPILYAENAKYAVVQNCSILGP